MVTYFMNRMTQQKRPFKPINRVETYVYWQGGLMITIGKIPQKVKAFFQPNKNKVSAHVYSYYCNLVLAICISHRSTIGRLVTLLRNTTHRTNHGEFLWRSEFDEMAVVGIQAKAVLKRLYHKKCNDCLLILDDTQTIKRAKKMQAVGKIHHHATGTYRMGHTILKACLFYRGITIPLGSWLYVKKEHAKELAIPFKKLTELAGQIVLGAEIPDTFHVTVLFDAFYLCPAVVNACQKRQWRYIGVSKSNRWLTVHSIQHKVGTYGKNILARTGRWYSMQGLRKTSRYKLAQRVGTMNKLGRVKVVFSKRRNDRTVVALVTNDIGLSMKKIVRLYLKRWAIEVMIKEQKQHLGLGDYRVWRYRAIVRHLCLVDSAYACLTHVGMDDQRAQGDKNETKDMLSVPPISQLKARMQQILWRQEVQNVIKVSHDKKVIRRLEKLLAA
jgi:SRSO17 transposase